MELVELDLDRPFQLPGGPYDFTFFLGTLYHLRNPFHVLEELAKRTAFCFLSTRIARRFPGGAKPAAQDRAERMGGSESSSPARRLTPRRS